MAASLAHGTTVIENAAREPEITDVADCLNKMGAKITGAGSSRIVIEGVAKLNGARHRVLPDRIETGTYAMAVAMTGGDVLLENARAELLQSALDVLVQAGVEITPTNTGVRVARNGSGIAAVEVTTSPFPGFPTDLQAQLMALMTRAKGTSHITETIFENRFMHVQELVRLGAHIQLDGECATIEGVDVAQRRAGDGHRSARLGLPRHRRARGRRRDRRQSRLSSRPRFRAARGQALGLWRRDRAHQRVIVERRVCARGPRTHAEPALQMTIAVDGCDGRMSRVPLRLLSWTGAGVRRQRRRAVGGLPRRPKTVPGGRVAVRPQNRERLGVSEGEWDRFVDREIMPRFPNGLTVFNASGQWRDQASKKIVRESSKVVQIVLPGEDRGHCPAERDRRGLQTRFNQQSVGPIVRPACVSFYKDQISDSGGRLLLSPGRRPDFAAHGPAWPASPNYPCNKKNGQDGRERASWSR